MSWLRRTWWRITGRTPSALQQLAGTLLSFKVDVRKARRQLKKLQAAEDKARRT